MELKNLENFLAIVREESITGAANALHLSQPALTRELKLLEEELGCQLIIRGNRRITLTEEGMLLRRRAEELTRLAERTKRELSPEGKTVSGEIWISAGETEGLSIFTAAMKKLRERAPDVRFHISSGDGSDVLEEIEKGLVDFGLVFGEPDASKYDSLSLPHEDVWGVFMRKDHPLASSESIRAEELRHIPLIVPRGAMNAQADTARFLGIDPDEVNVSGTYSLLFNASLMVRDELGCALGLDGILNLTGDTPLCFRPLAPRRSAAIRIVWKRYRVQSKAAEEYLAEIRKVVSES